MVESILRTNHADILSVSSQYFPPVCISTPHFEALKQNQNLILRFWRQTAIFKSSFWGLDTEIKATKYRFGSGISTECSKWALGGTANLPSGQNVHPEMKPQILRFSRQRKGSQGILPFPLCPKSAKATFNGQNWTVDFKCHIWTLDFFAWNSQRVPWKKSQNMVK